MQIVNYSLAVLLLSSLSSCNGYKILVTTLGVSGSQNLIMYRLADMLGSRGHQVTLLNWEIFPEAPSVKLEYAKEIKYPFVPDGTIKDAVRNSMSTFPWKKLSLSDIDLKHIRGRFTMLPDGCAAFLNDTSSAVYKQLTTERYDTIVLHMIDICTFGVAKHVNNPSIVWMTTAFMIDFMAHYSGVPYPSSFVPSFITLNTDKMSFFSRMKNMLASNTITFLFDCIFLSQFSTVFRNKFGANFPSAGDLLRQSQLIYVNADPFFDYARPIQHNIIYMGGMTMEKPELLTGEWLELLEGCKGKGVVLFSMGSVAKTDGMPMEMKTAIVNAFAHFSDYTFLFRIDGDVPKLPKNVRHIGWMPQKEMLAHPKVKLFITHGGYNSLTEATYIGVPLIVIPLFGDQGFNAVNVERHGIGVVLDKETLAKEDIIAEAVGKVLGDPSYERRAMRLADMIRKKPTHSAELALKWIEFLAEFRTVDNLLPESRHLGFVQYYNLDVLAILALAALLSFYILFKLLKCCCSCCCGKRIGTSGKSKNKKE